MTALPSKTGTRSVTGAALLAALAATLIASASLTRPAQAQGYRVFIEEDEVDAILPPRAVIVRLGRAGYSGMSHPRFDGETYRVEADSPWGNRVQLVVDARSGRILDRERLEAPLIPPGTIPGGRRPGFGWTEADIRPPAPRDGILRERGSRDDGPRVGGPYPPPMPLSRGEPLPPADLRPEERRVAARPLPQALPPVQAPSAAARAPSAAGPNPLGLNPDSPAARGGAGPRRETTHEGPKPEAPRKTAARTKPPEKPETPAALVPPLAPKAEPAPKPETKAADAAAPKAPEAKSADGGWKTPPEGNRPVRVIGGITQVPGKDEPAKE
ncbi:hypothetical protein [Methylobacterium nonmethylotrophicum]|uniref:PepSY domain-containing protein n=1 Tax=Methylobacterium nonmethylotrophicum TaxID=1141884 RepID=A0A4Z0NSH4_9HYPH|nr:hypothetical protein [Methylobacterium nonmethylotrophicum]TGE00222.1 hypothetical protein EU555_10005 [Methylobacterium nonmethylotrophicum]